MDKTKKYERIWILIIMIYLLIPLAITMVYSMFQKWTKVLPEKFSLSGYGAVFSDKLFLYAVIRSIVMCIIPIAVTTVIVLLALFVAFVYFPGLKKFIQMICMIPYSIQGVILSVSILSFYVSVNNIFSNRYMMLCGAYCVIILPYMFQGIYNGMNAIEMSTLMESAQMLGAGGMYAFFRVIVPNIATSIFVSALLAMGIIFGDYVLVRNLTGTAFENMQIYLYQIMKTDSVKASAVFVIIMMITFCITAAVFSLKGKERIGHHKKRGRK